MKHFPTHYRMPIAPGRRANVKISAGAPQYPTLLEATKVADPADWKFEGSELWVSLNLIISTCGQPPIAAKAFR